MSQEKSYYLLFLKGHYVLFTLPPPGRCEINNFAPQVCSKLVKVILSQRAG